MAQETTNLIAMARDNAGRLRARFDNPQDDPLAFAVVRDVYDLTNDLEQTRGDVSANERSEDARLAIAEARLADLASVRDELRDHVANLRDKQPWDNRAMFDRLLAALETATKE